MSPDTSSFDKLLAQHRGVVFKVAGIYARDPEERRDLIQEILTQTWGAFPHYDCHRPFSTWLYRIALNVAISHRRSAASQNRRFSDIAEAPEPAAVEPDDRLRELYRMIGRLDDLNRALVLLYLEGRNYGEMAEVLGISETKAATKLSRIKQQLRKEASTSERSEHGTR